MYSKLSQLQTKRVWVGWLIFGGAFLICYSMSNQLLISAVTNQLLWTQWQHHHASIFVLYFSVNQTSSSSLKQESVGVPWWHPQFCHHFSLVKLILQTPSGTTSINKPLQSFPIEMASSQAQKTSWTVMPFLSLDALRWFLLANTFPFFAHKHLIWRCYFPHSWPGRLAKKMQKYIFIYEAPKKTLCI